jgi:hypothetical protein
MKKYPDLIRRYAKEKEIEFRLNYPTEFNDFVLFFS